MWAYMTTGTTKFLYNLALSHSEIDFSIMKGDSKATLYYEDTKKKGIFVSGRKLEVLQSVGKLEEDGYVVMQHVPVSEDGKEAFADRVMKNVPKIAQYPGLQAVRFLKQDKQSHYILLTQWEAKRYYDNWTKVYNYDEMDPTKLARLPAYFSERPFTSTFYMLTEEDIENLEL